MRWDIATNEEVPLIKNESRTSFFHIYFIYYYHLLLLSAFSDGTSYRQHKLCLLSIFPWLALLYTVYYTHRTHCLCKEQETENSKSHILNVRWRNIFFKEKKEKNIGRISGKMCFALITNYIIAQNRVNRFCGGILLVTAPSSLRTTYLMNCTLSLMRNARCLLPKT